MTNQEVAEEEKGQSDGGGRNEEASDTKGSGRREEVVSDHSDRVKVTIERLTGEKVQEHKTTENESDGEDHSTGVNQKV